MFSANSSQVSDDKLFVEDVFSTYLYTGNSGTQTITNGIDLAGKGGLIWLKSRSSTAGHPIGSHHLFDTVRGIGAIDYVLRTNLTDAQSGVATIESVNSDGFTFGGGNPSSGNFNGETYASWTFREAPKFFDIVTYTGDGTLGRQINHSLGVTPGFIVVKRTDSTGNWMCVHRNNPSGEFVLNSTAASTGNTDNIEIWTSTYIAVSNAANINGATYVAYLFAHDATSDGIIQCGSYTGTGAAGNNVTLGWEPQWVMVKSATSAFGWFMFDNMRGMSVTDSAYLLANTSAAETANTGAYVIPNATGFSLNTGSNGWNASGETYIYMAIRRPMKTPTLGTSVFAPFATSLAVDTAITTNFPVDLMISGQRNSNNATDNWAFIDRLRGATASNNTSGTPQKRLKSTSTSTEDSPTHPYAYNWWNTGLVQGYGLADASQIYYTLRRAPGFFDEVCYTGTGAARTVNHNLGVAPELMIVKGRSVNGFWAVYAAPLGIAGDKYLALNDAGAAPTYGSIPGLFNGTLPTSTQFTVGAASQTNQNAQRFVAYLFASAPGVSKVGSYTGNGSSQTINCGFAAGARFVMIKRTDSTGDWYVWDTARGIVAGNDPHLSLNDLSAEVTTDDSVDTASSGFVVNQVAATNVNVNAATYIYLAIA